jgi:hypothetical protein
MMETSMRQAAARRDHSLTWHLTALKMVVAVPLLALAIIPTSIYIASERVRLESVAEVAREDILSLVDRDFVRQDGDFAGAGYVAGA